ncbi:outer membrane protein assembly factor BamD [Enterobacteriaceae endosymbiont of Donacia thalassina]|uniref:outer membrane protein assembly factor BamD n=1 Tax=Enterobacteriaceae endosymbiont of Donacia thalassina TaxID=2675786 RepID=UPI001448B9D6|nr:outer membrane protein assembly factor BamD [Enterobacteriaceae endosymbiont of Donacia thalassina]QJC37477.1 outer membrane protein assembly factor BamD [Enterobacteriaceae endosymbiont of Donacia thalassina]
MKIFIKNRSFFINILICILLIFTTNCEYYSISKKKHLNYSFKHEYINAIKILNEKKYNKALIKFSNLYVNYPYNIYTEKILVYLMFLNYLHKDFLNVLELSEEFIQSYNFSAFMSYVIYIRILSEISLDTNTKIQNFFRINRYFCNPFYTQLAIHDIKIFMKNYPNSIYINFLKKKLFNMEKRVKFFDLNIIKFLFKKKNYIATINRCLIFLKEYPSSIKEINLVKKILKISCNEIHLKI